MRHAWFAAVGLLLFVPARAQQLPLQEQQSPSIQEQQLPPLQEQQSPREQWEDNGQEPIQTPPPSRPLTLAPRPPPDMTPVSRPNTWLPAGAVRLEALDKVNAQATALTVKVGASATFGSLTITAKACVVRPPDQPADAAAYLDVTDSHPDSPPFAGWLLSQEPSVSMMEHPIYDIRVTGCT